jgi:hypothetical protein
MAQRQVSGFLWVLWFPPPIKTDHHDITEILLKVALNTISQAKPSLIEFWKIKHKTIANFSLILTKNYLTEILLY